jgi:hypothetical protein
MFTGLKHFQNFPTQGTHSFKSLLFNIAASQQSAIGLCCHQATTSFYFLIIIFLEAMYFFLNQSIPSALPSTTWLSTVEVEWDSNPRVILLLYPTELSLDLVKEIRTSDPQVMAGTAY